LEGTPVTIHNDPLLRLRAAQDPATPVDVLLDLATTVDDNTAIAARAAANPALTAVDLEFLYITSASSAAHYGIAVNPNSPSCLLDRLVEHPREWVRILLAQRGHALRWLAHDPSASVRVWVARGTDLALGEVLVDDSDTEVRRALAANRSAAPTLLVTLAGDSESRVRAAVADHPFLTAEMALQLAEDRSHDVLARLAGNPAAAGVLPRLARRRQSVTTRYAVAGNPACPPALRSRLALRDPSRSVRQLASWYVCAELSTRG
jgi:hypothetical protein